jgi:hypothetical protein
MGSLVLSSASLARFSKAHLFTDWQGPPPATPTRTPHLVVHDRGGGVRDCGGDSSTGDRLRAVMPPGEAAGIDAQVLLLKKILIGLSMPAVVAAFFRQLDELD